ncbi:hypothetical protein CDAR_71701 [Caerostris darwini]|uniref:Uncharacterized protein n=1 Tax=Caerostris darwini TaxID=1538125 RepID=A0AAV4NLL6_9ARAC|nr:hypothetical protein CDAR_71701 [Caerostris darwini]
MISQHALSSLLLFERVHLLPAFQRDKTEFNISNNSKNNTDFAYESSFLFIVQKTCPLPADPTSSNLSTVDPLCGNTRSPFVDTVTTKLRPMATFVTQAHGFALEHA